MGRLKTARRLIPGAALAISAACAAFAIGEAVLSVVAPQPYPGYNNEGPERDLYLPDFHLGRRPVEAAGMRAWNPRGEKTALLLGDSFTAHFAPRLISLAAERHFPDGVEFIDGGVQTFGTGQESALYGERWPDSRPHWVVLGFYIGNDFLDNADYDAFLRQRTGLQRFNLFRLLLRSLGRIRPWNPPGLRPHPDTEHGPLFLYASELERELCLFRAGANGLRPWEISTTFDDLISLEREVRRRGGRLAVVLIPRDVQVEPASVLRVVYGETAPGALDLELPNRRLAEFLKAHRIPFLDLLPGLRVLAKSGPLYRYRENNIHWNERGAKAAAGLTLDWLTAEIVRR